MPLNRKVRYGLVAFDRSGPQPTHVNALRSDGTVADQKDVPAAPG